MRTHLSETVEAEPRGAEPRGAEQGRQATIAALISSRDIITNVKLNNLISKLRVLKLSFS
jgi:hypothetical protein